MKKTVALLAVVLTIAMLTLVAYADTFDGTMVRPGTADPNLFFHGGKYYMTQTGTSRIAVFETEHVDELGTLTLGSNISYKAYLNGVVYDPTVKELFGSGATINGTWSPEIHYIGADLFGEEYEGWYMFLGLRKNTGDSSMVRMVVLKSMTDSPKGPYGHPTNGTANYSQPVLDTNGDVWDEWACGQTTLTIPEGPYKGTYTMWVAEEGRGQSGSSGKFYQKIMIAKMKSPWQFDGQPGIVTTPTQDWEYAGASSTHPRVVEGATPVYGKNGEIFITYSGSGYWSDYGLGQLTWNGGDPLKTSSWVKLSVANGNPIFTATTAENLRGAGHASFLTDTDGNGFICYHAYAYDYVYDEETGKWSDTKVKASSRDAYIEPYYIDYSAWNGVSYGVIRLGINGNGVPADTASKVTFATDGSYLTAPDITASGGKAITLTMSESGATGYLIYRSTDNKTFNYLTTVNSTTYTDSNVTVGNTYYYRAYAYREEEISDVSETVSATVNKLSAPSLNVQVYDELAIFGVTATADYDGFEIYYSEDGDDFFFLYDSETEISSGETAGYATGDYFVVGETYYAMARGYKDGNYGEYSDVVEFTMLEPLTPPTITRLYQRSSLRLTLLVNINGDCDGVNIYSSTDGVDFTLLNTKTNDYSDGSMFTAAFDVETEGVYYYYVTCTRDGRESQPSEVKSINAIKVETPAISNVTATCRNIKLTFTANDEYDSYNIMLGTLKTDEFGEYYSFSKFASVTEPEYVLENIAIGKEYCFAVVGVIDDVTSALSGQIFTTPAHNKVEAEALAPTCTEDGYTAYTYCEYCDGVYSGKEVISAPGHSYELTEAEVPATTTSAGKTAVYTCGGCGDSYGGEEIPKLEDTDTFTMAGDANNDGAVNMLDILRTLKAAVGTELEINTANADMDGNGEITALDVLEILMLVLNTK